MYNSMLRCWTTLQPVRECLRSVRRNLQRARPQKDSSLDKAWFLLHATLAPLSTMALFYGEQIKNLALAVVMWNSVMDFSGGRPFGNVLFVLLMFNSNFYVCRYTV